MDCLTITKVCTVFHESLCIIHLQFFIHDTQGVRKPFAKKDLYTYVLYNRKISKNGKN